MSAKTYSALSTLAAREGAEALAEALEALSPAPIAVGFFELSEAQNIWEVEAYFDTPPDEIGLALLVALHKSSDFTLSELSSDNWVSQMRRLLHPVEVGRFFIHGSHDSDKVRVSHIPLLIEASTAFGTGHHDTTRACLWMLNKLIAQGIAPLRVADIGTGTGVLAMAAAKVLERAEIYASDIDPIAVEVARTNIEKNQLKGRIVCCEGAGVAHPALRDARPFDLIFANILKAPLIGLAKDFAGNLHPRGFLILSGILSEQGWDVIAAYEAEGLALKERHTFGLWDCLLITHPAPEGAGERGL